MAPFTAPAQVAALASPLKAECYLSTDSGNYYCSPPPDSAAAPTQQCGAQCATQKFSVFVENTKALQTLAPWCVRRLCSTQAFQSRSAALRQAWAVCTHRYDELRILYGDMVIRNNGNLRGISGLEVRPARALHSPTTHTLVQAPHVLCGHCCRAWPLPTACTSRTATGPTPWCWTTPFRCGP